MTNYHFWRGERIRLRAIEQKDLDAITQDFGEYDTDAEKFNSEIDFPSYREEDRGDFENLRKREPGNDAFFWLIENEDGENIGSINTFDCERRVGVFKYAILIRRPYWRRGYASEAIKLVARFYFRELGYQKLTAMVYSFNARSLCMHEKLGFVFEGRLRRTVYTNGRHYDTIYFGLTKEEFDRLDPPQALWEDERYVVSSPKIENKRLHKADVPMDYNIDTDPVIQALIAEATADPDVIGLVLTGSRAIGATGPDSDYDVVFVVTDEAMVRYEATKSFPARGATLPVSVSTKDMWNEAPRSLQLENVVVGMLPAWAEARILYDRSGEIERIFAPLRFMTAERAKGAVASFYDAYLNSFYRSLKCWRRGNPLGGRLEAAQSTDYLLHLLFALEQRWRPYSSRLIFHLHHLAGQGWQSGELEAFLLDLISTGNPTRQQALMQRVVPLLSERGFAHVYDDWEGTIDQARRWVFA